MRLGKDKKMTVRTEGVKIFLKTENANVHDILECTLLLYHRKLQVDLNFKVAEPEGL